MHDFYILHIRTNHGQRGEVTKPESFADVIYGTATRFVAGLLFCEFLSATAMAHSDLLNPERLIFQNIVTILEGGE